MGVDSFQERYPNGRKHCIYCKRYRHVIDFSVDCWEDGSKEVPKYLKSYCRVCADRRKRVRRGQLPYDERISAKKFIKYLDPYMRRDRGDFIHGNRITINHKGLSEGERRALHRWRTGEVKTVRLETADEWALRFGLPLWDIERTAKIAA